MQIALADERWFKSSYILRADAAGEGASAVLQFRIGAFLNGKTRLIAIFQRLGM
jgi:hypothetical protein